MTAYIMKFFRRNKQMKKSKQTKKLLFSSVIALILCFSMLVGTTFAWFTDEVTVEGNIIQSGTLDVDMKWANGKEDPASANWNDATVKMFENTLWEPGYTEARHIMIENMGTLALNWTLAIVPNGEVSALAEVIDVYIYGANKYAASNAKQVVDRDVSAFQYVGTLAEVLRTGIASGKLYAEASTGKYKFDSMTIVLKMREEAGNEYMNLTIGTGFDVKLMATQLSYESDGFDKDYDLPAGTIVATPENAQAVIWAAKEGDVIFLEGGAYGALVIANEDGTPKKGITIERHEAGTNSVNTPFSVESINLNGSEDITIRNIWFDAEYAAENGTAYKASIFSNVKGAASGAKNIVIDGCRFDSYGAVDSSKYVPILFEEQGRPTRRASNITVINCKLETQALNFVRANYLAEGSFIMKNNSLAAGCVHSAVNMTGNSSDITIRDNSFGSKIGSRIITDGWNLEKAALGTSRQGTHTIKVEVTGNTFILAAMGAEGHVVELKNTYTADNCELIFENNVFQAGLEGMTEDTVPCIWHN